MGSKRAVIDMSKPIMVTMESFAHMVNAQLVSDDGSTFKATLINCDRVSRNMTYYPLEDILLSMKDRRVQEKIEQKCFFGEAEHPSSDTEEPLPLKRLMRVEPSRWSHRIDSYSVNGSDIEGIVTWAGPFGETYQKEMLKGTNFAMSIRAYTPNFIKKDDKNGSYVIKKHLMFIASYDCVLVPGLEDARIMNPGKYRDCTKNDIISIKGNTQVRTSESLVEVKYGDVIGELKDIMRSQESTNIIGDLFGLDMNTAEMIIRGSNTLSVRSTEGRTLELPLSRTILSEIL